MLFPESRLGLVNSSNLFDYIFSEPSFNVGVNTANKMLTDIKETEEGYELAVEVPGVEKENLGLELKDGYLTVTAKRSVENKEESGKVLRQERYYGSSKRSFYVGKNLEKQDISAKYDKGILTILVPKKEPKKIEEQIIEIQ